MLELKDITKIYETKDLKVEALKGVSLKFRKNEFVSILGPSGCGKTTFLNIVGGLDKYTSGDLIINGKSTKDFSDRDWDSYRNHTIGFVFQSYNLIPHQTVLQNVEIALTLSGVTKAERRRKAVEALHKVGLGDKINSKPNQLSGGQMQRVAIARALVNDPDVVLADEPTGALDSKTSVQVMELLKEVAKDRLVIMVTHNPNLATEYSTRIIKFLDGELIDDSNPIGDQETEILDINQNIPTVDFTENVEVVKAPKRKRKKKECAFKKTTMSFGTALSLSFKNLLTKKARTLMVAIAGSIGIFGIALILALSSGFQSYINKTQEDTLAQYPITIKQTDLDMMSMVSYLFNSEESTHDADAVYVGDTMTGLFDQASSMLENTNDLESFSVYLEEHKSELDGLVSAIQYTYNFNFYATNGESTLTPNTSAFYDMIVMYIKAYMQQDFGVIIDILEDQTFDVKIDANTSEKGIGFLQIYLPEGYFSALMASSEKKVNLTSEELNDVILKAMGISIDAYKTQTGLFYEMIDNKELLQSQYELLGTESRWVSASNEVLLVLDENSEIDDYQYFCLGLISKDEMQQHLFNLFGENPTSIKREYNDIVGQEYKILLDGDYYEKVGDTYKDIKTMLTKGEITQEQYDEKYQALLNNPEVGKTIKISGVVRLKEEAKAGQLSTGIAYTKALTDELIAYQNNTAVVKNGQLSEVSKTPASISFYANTFQAKEEIEKFIANYNAGVDEEKQISYTDFVGLMMSSISTIISAISYVLIAFVSISLIVSSIMIGIITYISVLERIKEIGILRAVGASKKDVKRVFTAETLIIGFISGILGILTALLLTIPVNVIINALAGISGVAKLPVAGAIILIAISMLLTLIAGLIPARIASKKDPVVALRSE